MNLSMSKMNALYDMASEVKCTKCGGPMKVLGSTHVNENCTMATYQVCCPEHGYFDAVSKY